jgi:hypothetical protein
MITCHRKHLEERCLERGFALAAAMPCVVSQDGDMWTINVDHDSYPRGIGALSFKCVEDCTTPHFACLPGYCCTENIFDGTNSCLPCSSSSSSSSESSSSSSGSGSSSSSSSSVGSSSSSEPPCGFCEWECQEYEEGDWWWVRGDLGGSGARNPTLSNCNSCPGGFSSVNCVGEAFSGFLTREVSGCGTCGPDKEWEICTDYAYCSSSSSSSSSSVGLSSSSSAVVYTCDHHGDCPDNDIWGVPTNKPYCCEGVCVSETDYNNCGKSSSSSSSSSSLIWGAYVCRKQTLQNSEIFGGAPTSYYTCVTDCDSNPAYCNSPDYPHHCNQSGDCGEPMLPEQCDGWPLDSSTTYVSKCYNVNSCAECGSSSNAPICYCCDSGGAGGCNYITQAECSSYGGTCYGDYASCFANRKSC